MKEHYPCAASGQPCVQDTNPAGMPANATDTRCVIFLCRRSPPCEHQESEDDQRLLPNVHNEYKEQNSDQANKRLSNNGQPITGNVTNDTGHFVRQESSTFTSSELSSYSYMSSGRQMSPTKKCDTCRFLMESFPCEASKIFWNGVPCEGPDSNNKCHKKFFEKFLLSLKNEFQQEEGLHSHCTINLLKRLLKIDPKDKTAGVNLADLMRLIELFGPIRLQNNRCILIHKLHDLVKRSLKARDRSKTSKSSWFVGDMTRSEAEDALLDKDCKDKTYLIRISGTDGGDGDFALSVLHEDHCHHFKIKGNPKQALEEADYNAHLRFAGREFSSLPDVVDYITANNDIEIEQNDGDDENFCKYVKCLRVFLKSPLNGPMWGYERTKNTH